MNAINFADSYKAAGLSPRPEIITLRQVPFDKLVDDMNTEKEIILDLTRLFFGLPVPGGTEWFRDSFGETDPSFSMFDNEREAAVLSACLLRAAINNKVEVAALAVLTTSANGNRKPVVLPELIEIARIALTNIAVENRHHQTTELQQIKMPAKTTIDAAADDLVAAADWPKVAALFKNISGENRSAIKNLANQLQNVLSPLAEQITDLKEEVEMLWWHIGGWSRIIEKPFTNIKPGLTAVMAGLDLADLSKSLAGPVAAPAILHRTISAGCGGSTGKTSIKEAVDAFLEEALGEFQLEDKLKDVPDICPVLTAFLKAYEIGESSAWVIPFEKAAAFDSSVEIGLLDLAMQVYRERSLLAAFD